MNKTFLRAAALAACAVASAATSAATYEWTAGSGLRPDLVGAMARVATGAASDALAPGGPLSLRSGDDEEWMYYLSIGRQLEMPEQLDLSFTARYVAGHTDTPLRSPLMVGANLVGGRGATLVIGDGAVSFLRHDDAAFSSTHALDTSQFHDYRLVVSGPQNGAPLALFVDGVQRLSDHLSQGSLYTPHARIWFGDSTWGAGGVSEWQRFSHNAAAAVPEPGSALLLALGGMGLLVLRRLQPPIQGLPQRVEAPPRA